MSTMDENSVQNEKISIKNLLFTKAIPNYILPISAAGRPIFSCTDCGDKFLIQSSYEYHINRRSLKITYSCRYCNVEKIFYNRCNLLSHIRSHVFKTATINISDLKIELLPLNNFNSQIQNNNGTEATSQYEVPLAVSWPINLHVTNPQNLDQIITNMTCFECKQNILSSGILHMDRAKHYTQYTSILYSCPICLLTLQTQCALKAHLRLHFKEPPYYCPECGIHLPHKALLYPYTHHCESFKMMRVTAKITCSIQNCNQIFHPNESNKHFRTAHIKKVYKCSACCVACYNMANMQKHLKLHSKKIKSVEFYQCGMCPGRLITLGQIDKHLKGHENYKIYDVYPCWTCGATFRLPKSLIQHQIYKHQDADLKEIFGDVSQDPSTVQSQHLKTRSFFEASKRCNKCLRHFISRCPSNIKYTPLDQLPCQCTKDVSTIVCHLCKFSVILNWVDIKKHYRTFHREHICLDAKIVVNKLNINPYFKGLKKLRKTNRRRKKCNMNDKNVERKSSTDNNLETLINSNKFMCNKCGEEHENKQLLEKHMVIHKDPFMAYQCLECGESFIAKPSFATHLLLKHGIDDVNAYINEKKCYSKESLHTNQKRMMAEENEPVKENQCNICREQFCNTSDLEKHFRVHGMAFLMKNTNKTSKSPDRV